VSRFDGSMLQHCKTPFHECDNERDSKKIASRAAKKIFLFGKGGSILENIRSCARTSCLKRHNLFEATQLERKALKI
jgi:hypothetical protein